MQTSAFLLRARLNDNMSQTKRGMVDGDKRNKKQSLPSATNAGIKKPTKKPSGLANGRPPTAGKPNPTISAGKTKKNINELYAPCKTSRTRRLLTVLDVLAISSTRSLPEQRPTARPPKPMNLESASTTSAASRPTSAPASKDKLLTAAATPRRS